MAKKIAVMILHGMGDQNVNKPDDSSIPTFSKKMHRAVRREFGAKAFDAQIAWREVTYSHITQENQDIYFKKVKRRLSFDSIREFVIKYLGDVAAYTYDPDDKKNDTYAKIHAEVTSTLKELKQDTSKDAPIVILAHSFGGHVISNYIYDLQKSASAAADLTKLNTVAALVTFGCNIPLFTFGWKFNDIKAIKYPGDKLPASARLKNWWRNYYDKQDVLGYPLAPTGIEYEKLADKKELKDFKIDVGWFGANLTPFSHSMYWGDVDLIRPIHILLKKLANNS